MNENKTNVKYVSPLKRICMTIGELPSSYIETMSYYEMLVWFTEFLKNQVIPTVNNNAEAVNELQHMYDELKEYVDNYFDNLDVQEAIDNKLDEMVESGDFATIINNYFNPNFKIIMPKNFTNVDSGDIMILKAYDKNIVIDTFYDDAYSQVEDFLDRNGITSIDYLILTHYHEDHVGNVENLILNNYLNQNSYVYLPGYSTLITQDADLLAMYNMVNNSLTTAGIPHSIPEEGDELTIQDFKLTFYNCQSSIFEEMGVTNYNDCSTVCLCEYGNEKALFTADISDKPFKRFVNNQMFNYKIDIYKLEHHGNNIDNEDVPFLQQIMPSLALHQTTSYSIEEMGRNVRSSGLTFMMNYNIPIFSQYNNDNDVIIDVFKDRYSLVQGKQNYAQSSYAIINQYTVDPSTTNTIQNGSANFPFKNIGQALSKINKMDYARNEIILKNGTYTNPTKLYVEGAYVEITGQSTAGVVIKTPLIFNNCHVLLSNITFDLDNSPADTPLNIRYSSATLNNCKVTSSSSTLNQNYGITSVGNLINIRSTTIEYASYGIYSQYDRLYGVDDTFQYNTNPCRFNRSVYGFVNRTDANNTNGDTLNDPIDINDKIPRALVLNQETITPSVNATITGTKNFSNYNALIISFGATSQGTFQTYIINGYHNGHFVLNDQFVIKTTAGNVTFKLTSANVLTVTARDSESLSIRQVLGINL